MASNQRVVLTPAVIAEAAKDLFSTCGYANTSIEDIADRLGVRKGAVYYHVPRKSDLLIQVISDLVQPIATHAAQIAVTPGDPWQQLSDLVRHHVEQLLANQQAARVFFEQYRDIPASHTAFAELFDQIEMAFTRVLTSGMASGAFRRTDASLLRMHVLALCNWPYRWFDAKGSHSAQEVTESVWQQVAALVRPVSPASAETVLPSTSAGDADIPQPQERT